MKTGKKLLSLFLAVVMAVSACSVGFTAFAKSKSSDVFNQPKDANETYDGLVQSIYDYLPSILDLIGDDTLSKVGIDKEKIREEAEKENGKPFYELITEISPSLLGLLASKGDPSSLISNYTKITDVYYSYLNDNDAALDFFTLYAFCNSNKNSSDTKLSEYANATLPKLQALLNLYQTTYDKYASSEGDLENELGGIIASAAGSGFMTMTAEQMAELTVSYGGSNYKVDDLINIDHFKPFQKNINKLDAVYSECAGERVQTISQYFYKFIQDQAMSSNYFAMIYKFFAVKGGATGAQLSDFTDANVSSNKYFSEVVKGMLSYTNMMTAEDYDKTYNERTISNEEIDTIKTDIAGTKAMQDTNIFKAYLNGGKFTSGRTTYEFDGTAVCSLNKEAVDALLNNGSFVQFFNYIVGKTSTIKSNDDCRNLIKVKIVNGIRTEYFGSTSDSSQYTPMVEYFAITKYVTPNIAKEAVSQGLIDSESDKIYDYSKYGPDSSLLIQVVNSTINGYLQYLNPDDPKELSIGGMNINLVSTIDDVLKTFLGNDTKITCKVLYNSLYDIYINLAEKPVDTLLELMPLLTTIIDKAIVPLIFTDDASVADLPFQVYGILCGASGPLYKYTQESEKANGVADADTGAVGIGQLNFDLNYILPALLNYMTGDTSSIKGYYTEAPYDTTVPKITNIYIADKWIKENLYNMAFTSAKNDDGSAKMATGVQEILTKVVSSAANSATELYFGKYDSSKPATTCLAKGANNLLNALPEFINGFVQSLKTDFNITTDWTYGKQYTISETKDGITSNVNYYGSSDIDSDNTFLNKLESMYASPKAADIFDEFSNFIVQDLLDAIIDLANDIFTSDNTISKNIPIVTGVVKALGGFGEKSVVTDILNGVFQLTRKDKCSFTLEEQSSGYVGFSTMSGYFLLANIKPIVDVVMATVDSFEKDTKTAKTASLKSAFASSVLSSNPSDNSKAISTASSASSLLTKDNVKASTETIAVLDELLSDLLSNTYINGYKADATDNIISGVVSLLSNYIGNDNAEAIMQLLNSYTFYLSNGKAADAKGNIKDKQIYTDANLSNLIVQTYALLENIVENLLKTTGSVTVKDVNGKNADYNVIIEAVEGAISPDSVAMHMDGYDAVSSKLQDYQCWHKMLSLKKATKANKLNPNLSNNIGNTNVTLNYNISAGDKEAFYNALSESFGMITSVISVIFVDANLYKNTFNPIFTKLLSKVDEKGHDFNGTLVAVNQSIYAPEKVLKGNKDDSFFALIRPIGVLLDAFYAQPATVLVELLQGVASLLDDSTYPNLHVIISNTLKPINGEIHGLGNIVGVLSSTYKNDLNNIDIANVINDAVQTAIDKSKDKNVKKYKFNINTFKGASVIPLINVFLKSNGFKLSQCDFHAIASTTTPKALLLILGYVIDNVMDNIKKISGLFEFTSGSSSSLKELVEALQHLTAADVLAAITTVIKQVKNPTEIYWTFYQYIYEKVYNFKYPLGITAGEANNAVDQLDSLVANIFPLLNSLGVTDISGLSGLVNDNLYTNKMLTTIATALYGAMQGDVAKYLKAAGIDTTTKGVAKLLTNSSYGTTYSSAASTIRNAKSWKSIKTINWGFKDGSSNAKQGFVKGIAAIFRPFNQILSVFLANGSISTGSMICNVVKTLNIKSGTVTLKNGVLTIKVKGEDKRSIYSTIKMNLNPVLNDLKKYGKIVGHNGYESAIVPLLEAFNCPNIKSYSRYVSDCKKAKDNVLIDVLNPLLGFVSEVCDTPFDTLTSVLPNLAYFIDNGGLTQFVTGLIGVQISNPNLIRVQDYIIPLVNTLLSSNDIAISIPNIDWSYLAGLGTAKTVKSAAKNTAGTYTRKAIVDVKQGQVLITVLRYILNTALKNMSEIKTLLAGIKMSSTVKKILNSVLSQLGTATSDEVICALFYFLTEEPTNAFWDYSGYTSKNYTFTYPKGMDIDFIKNLSPMIDGIISGFLDLNSTIGKLIYKDDIINKLAKLIYTNVEKVKITDGLYLDDLLAQTGIDFTTSGVASLLTNTKYGDTYSSAAATISSSSSWSKVNFDNLKWNVKDRASFLHALCAILRPAYGVLDVLLNDGSLGLFSLISVPGSNGYTSSIVPLLEAFGGYNIKTQYQYRKDIAKSYDNILLDVLNPLMDKVEDILYAPLQTITSMIPNLAFFFANDGLLQLIDNLVTPVTALLNAVKPIVDVNDLLSKLGVKLGGKSLDLYHISSIVEPYIGKENVVPMLNSLLSSIDIKGTKLGIKLNDIDWFQLASHGTVVTTGASQAATFGSRVYVDADSSATLIAVLRYLINTIQTGDNLKQIQNLISGLVGGSNSTVTDVVGTVLNMFKEYKGDDLIAQLAELLQTLGS